MQFMEKLSNVALKPLINKRWYIFEYLNIIFNRVDEERRKVLGPDRVCAEWLLRNGGAIKWKNAKEFLTDYNSLPAEGHLHHVQEVDATDSSISHHGFDHFVGCKHIEKMILRTCNYIEDDALKMLKPISESLKYIEISNCANVTGVGLMALVDLTNLQVIIISNLPYVNNKEDVLKLLQHSLTKCDINFK